MASYSSYVTAPATEPCVLTLSSNVDSEHAGHRMVLGQTIGAYWDDILYDCACIDCGMASFVAYDSDLF